MLISIWVRQPHTEHQILLVTPTKTLGIVVRRHRIKDTDSGSQASDKSSLLYCRYWTNFILTCQCDQGSIVMMADIKKLAKECYQGSIIMMADIKKNQLRNVIKDIQKLSRLSINKIQQRLTFQLFIKEPLLIRHQQPITKVID